MGRNRNIGIVLLLGGATAVSMSVCRAAAAEAESPLAFAQTTLSGTTFRLPDDGPPAKWTVVCFLGTECPLARLYGPRLENLSRRFDAKVRFVGIFSNQQDTPDEIQAYAEEHGIQFALIKDADNQLADTYQALRTPEVFVVDPTLTIRYRGRIDDQYLPGIARNEPQRDDLKLALDELIAGRAVSVPVTEAPGCLIGRVKEPKRDSDVTFCNQVIRILQRNCVECHRTGEIAPFALTEYDEVVGWAEMILEVVQDGRMPPWHASADHAELANARWMGADEKQQLAEWVAAGAPYGDEEQLPPTPQYTSGWQFPRQPDVVIEMRDRPFVVPAEGTVEYQYFVVDPGFSEDRWVAAAQVIPGNAAVVHHSIVFVRPPDGERFRGVGWLGAYVPGQRAFVLPPGRARFVPAGSKLVFQQHYTPTGTRQEDLTRVGLLFADPDAVTHEVLTLVGIDQEFEIPPHAAAHQVEGHVRWFPPRGELLAIMPHMHLRGRSFRFSQIADGHEQTVLEVPRYDFNWQHVYQLAQPLPLADIDQLKFAATFDNSAANPNNPDPEQWVTWGDQTWEEMAVAFFEVAEPRGKQPTATSTADAEARDPQQHQRVEKWVREFFAEFDRDGDGIVFPAETPLSFRRFGFRQFDENEDQRLTTDEIERSAWSRLR